MLVGVLEHDFFIFHFIYGKSILPIDELHDFSRWLKPRTRMCNTIDSSILPWVKTTNVYLSAYARQPARGPTMLAHLVAICWPMLTSCWPMWSQKIRKMGTAKKRCKTQDILMVGGLSWGYVGPSWGYVGPSWGYVGPAWGYVGPSWGYVGPSWGVCCPMLRLCWSILRPMLAPVDPSWATKAEKWEKMGRAQNTVKRGSFWRHAVVGGRGRGPSLLWRGEKRRTAMPRPGGPWPDLRAAAPAADPGQKKRFVCLRDDTRTKEFAQVRSSFAVTRRCLLLPFASDIFWCNPQSSQVRWMDVCVGDILWSFAWDM